MNALVGEVFSAWDQLSESFLSVTNTKGRLKIVLDVAHITPKIIALGDVPDTNLDALVQMTNRDPVVIWNLGAVPLSKLYVSTFDNQIINYPWNSPHSHTKAPLLHELFALCQSIKSWYDLNDKNLAIVRCPPGLPSTGILVACLLKYIGAFEHTTTAYDFYCSKRMFREDTSIPLAPSYQTLFDNIDKTVDNNGYRNGKPLHLKTLTIAGLPVDEIPSVEIYDMNGLVFASHVGFKHTNMCTWNAEFGDGFFKISQDILGDFALICRFGGHLATNKDKSTLIFKYQNTTAFMPDEVLDLRHYHVDVNPQYADSLDVDMFKIHMMFETDVNVLANIRSHQDPAQAALKVFKELPEFVKEGRDAFEIGLDEISRKHPVMAEESKCIELNNLVNDEYSSKYVAISLQLSNNSVAYGSKLITQMKHRSLLLMNTLPTQEGAAVTSEEVCRSSPSSIVISDVSSEDSSWEVVASCPVCRDDNQAKADQLIPCSLCNRSYHTWCVEIRKIPFNNAEDKHKRETYIQTHFGEWKCSHCVLLSKETAESPSTNHIPKNSTVDTFDIVDPVKRRHNSISGNANSVDDINEGRKTSQSANNMMIGGIGSSPSRFLMDGSPGEGGCVIITDKIHSSSAVLKSSHHTTAAHSPTDKRRGLMSSPATPDLTVSQHALKHPQTPSFPSSKHDQIALLIGCLSENNLTVEDLLAMTEKKRKETIMQVMSVKLSGFPQNSLNTFQYAKQFDLATAMRGILANNAALSVTSDSARSQAVSEVSTESNHKKNDSNVTTNSSGISMTNSYVQVNANNNSNNANVDPNVGPVSSTFDARKNMIELIKKKAAGNKDTPTDIQVAKNDWSAPLTPFVGPNNGGIAFEANQQQPGQQGQGGVGSQPGFGFGSNFSGGFGYGNSTDNMGPSSQYLGGGVGGGGVSGSGLGGVGGVVGGAGGAIGLGVGGTGTGTGFESGVDVHRSSEGSAGGNGRAGGTGGAVDESGGLELSTKIKELPEFVKYFKMMKVGIAKNAVAEKLFADGLVDSQQLAMALLNLDPDQPLPDQFLKKPEAKEPEKPAESDADKKVAVAEHPKYSKYFKMLKVGLPKEAIKAKMKQEGVDEDKLDLDPTTLIYLDDRKDDKGAMVSISEHPKYSKFFKMLKVGLPKPAIKGKMTQEGVDPEMIEKDPTELIPLDDSPKVEMVPVGEHPKYVKFFKMMKVGLPKDAIKAKMIQEGVDPNMIDKDPKDLIPLDEKAEVEEMIAVSEHEKYAKFFKMKKVGLAVEAIKAKMVQEGLDPSYIDKDAKEMVPVNPKPAGAVVGGLKGIGGLKLGAPVSKIKKKKIYWKALDASKVNANSLWATGDSDNIVMDEDEFNKLFVDTGENSAKEVVKVMKEPKKQKVNIINMKRAQNAGIALARIRFKYEDMREKIMSMDDEGLTTDQLKSLEEFLPTHEECGLIKAYKGDILLLGQAEKYMLVMLGFDDAPKRIKCMIYKQQFKSRVLECRGKLSKIENACDDVKLSSRLKKVLKTILKVGNQLNDGEEHKGFTLDSLLKLQSAKAFDKKTSILQYVIMLIYRNDPDCLKFNEDLKHVAEASRLTFESVAGEKNALREEFDVNFKIVMDIAENDPDCNTGSMIDFLQKAEEQNRDLQKRLENVKNKFTGVLNYFGEDPQMTSVDFFTTLDKFVFEFVTTRDAVERLRRQESRKQAAELKSSAAATGDDSKIGDKPNRQSRRHSTATGNKESEDHIKKDHSEADREQLRALRNTGRSSNKLTSAVAARKLPESTAVVDIISSSGDALPATESHQAPRTPPDGLSPKSRKGSRRNSSMV